MEGEYAGIARRIRVVIITPVLQYGEGSPLEDGDWADKTPSGEAGAAAPSQDDSRGGAPPTAPAPTDKEKAYDPERMKAED